MEVPFDLAILLGLYPKNPETPIQKNLCIPMFIAAKFTIVSAETTKVPISKWIYKNYGTSAFLEDFYGVMIYI